MNSGNPFGLIVGERFGDCLGARSQSSAIVAKTNVTSLVSAGRLLCLPVNAEHK
jgi:hypothetical protein